MKIIKHSLQIELVNYKSGRVALNFIYFVNPINEFELHFHLLLLSPKVINFIRAATLK